VETVSGSLGNFILDGSSDFHHRFNAAFPRLLCPLCITIVVSSDAELLSQSCPESDYINDIKCYIFNMHEMQTVVTDVRGICPSVCHVAQLCGAFVQPLPNYFGLLLCL